VRERGHIDAADADKKDALAIAKHLGNPCRAIVRIFQCHKVAPFFRAFSPFGESFS
jgi:hypothetical protein